MIDKWNDIREIEDTSQVQLNIEFKGFDFILFWGLSVKRSMLKLDAPLDLFHEIKGRCGHFVKW